MSTSSHYHKLKSKWTTRHRDAKTDLVNKHQNILDWAWRAFPSRHLAATSLSALLLLIPPLPPHLNVATRASVSTEQQQVFDKKSKIKADLQAILPSQVRPLSVEEEQNLVRVLSRDTQMIIMPELNGIRLNRSYGLIGGEQHLLRYPGDTLAQHAIAPEDHKMFLPSGLAPSTGSFSYFASSKSELTAKDIERERYYIAVPYHLIPDYNQNAIAIKEFFKYRKMLVVNPNTGAAVVTVVGDAGPGQSTGKHLGGSPEVMHFLDLGKGARKGGVVYFFIDDPNDTIPLGPIT